MRVRQYLKRVLPQHHHLRDHRQLRLLGSILHDPEIFHLTRRSAAGGTAVGLFVAFIPLPVQMLLAALVAILLRVNLPLAVVLVWVTNPVTFAPVFYVAYKIGTAILGAKVYPVQFEPTLHWLTTKFLTVWEPVLLGCLVLGTLSAVAGYVAVRLVWRLSVVRKVLERRNFRNGKKGKTENTR